MPSFWGCFGKEPKQCRDGDGDGDGDSERKWKRTAATLILTVLIRGFAFLEPCESSHGTAAHLNCGKSEMGSLLCDFTSQNTIGCIF